MKKYKVIKYGIQISGWTSDENLDETYWQESFGKPERWVLHKDEPMAEAYDDADVLEEKIEQVDGLDVKHVKLKAEYTIEIEDLDQNPTWLLEQCIAKRKAEYPSAEEFLNAYFDGGQSALDALADIRRLIKSKYPKP